MVTSTAGRGQVSRVDARCGIDARQNTVRCVTTRAHRCHGQSAFHQTLAVNAFSVPFNDIVLAPRVANGRLLSFAVTPRAEVGNVCREGDGLRVRLPQHPVCTVTLFACRSVGVVLCYQCSMRAFLILLADFCMTGGTIDFLGDCLARSQMRRIDA